MDDINAIEDSETLQSRQRRKSDSSVISKIIRRSSQQFSSIENLESLITCSIHLGLIEEPRQLPCGHAFCFSCLKNYLNHDSDIKRQFIICPLCRYVTTIDSHGLDVLAPSVVHKQLTEYLIIKRQRVVGNSLEYEQMSSETDTNVNDIKLELMRYLMKDFKKELSLNIENDLEKQLNSIFNENRGCVTQGKGRMRSLSDSGYRKENYYVYSKKTDVYKQLDHISIKKNMRKYREYKLIKSFTHPKQSEILQVSWIDNFGSLECSDDSEVMMYIVKNSTIIYFSNITGTKLRYFHLEVEGDLRSPFFVKHDDKTLFVVGRSNIDSILIKVSMEGDILKVSKKYSGCLGGFCVDNVTDTIVVAYPSEHSVLILNKTSLEEVKVCNFGELSPLYVAKSSNCHEIWVSCPENGRIAVYDEVQDDYLHLDTSQIYESLPTHINETKDHRILFLDSSWSRIFWIRRWNNQLYIQLLIVFGVSEEMGIKSVEPISQNMIMLSNNQWTYIAKPARSVKEEQTRHKCIML